MHSGLDLLQTPASFRLPDGFVEQYAERTHEPFEGNPMGYFVYKRTYARPLADGSFEEWYQTVRRVVEGCFRLQERHIKRTGLGWKPAKALEHAKEMYRLMFWMKFLPPGRGLWAMGSAITEERGIFAALNNCAFVSTETIADDLAKPFCFLMDMSMLGVGVGFDVKGAGKIELFQPSLMGNVPPAVVHGEIVNQHSTDPLVYRVGDTREGWVEALRVLLESYMRRGRAAVEFDFSEVRGPGLPIKGFGGVSSGPEPLEKMLAKVREICDAHVGRPITITFIADVMNLIGKAVIAGNVRRTAEIMFGEPDSQEYLDLKNPAVNPERNAPDDTGYGWTSNNSVFARVGMNYDAVAERTRINGEPGYAWLGNMQEFGRMADPPNYKDRRVRGGNPCLEQSLEPYELCCLVEVLPTKCETLADYHAALKYAYMYAKTVTLAPTHWAETNRVMLRNRRIGTSLTGLAQFDDAVGRKTFVKVLEGGYRYVQDLDETYSDWFAVPQSVKLTSVKPSGTVSKVAGVWAGVHRPDDRYIRRRIRVAANSPYVPALQEAGIHLEPSVTDPDKTVVASFFLDMGEGRTNKEVTIWEQVHFAALLQRYWADNQVSCTVTFDPDTEGDQITRVLTAFDRDLKGISFLPRLDFGAYPQMPEEAITEAEYELGVAAQGRLDLSGVRDTTAADGGVVASAHEADDEFCDGDACLVDFAAAS